MLFSLWGGDRRMDAAAGALSRLGHDVRRADLSVGADLFLPHPDGCVFLLPVPLTRDGVTLSGCPALPLSTVADTLPAGAVCLCGAPTADFCGRTARRGVRLRDLLCDPYLVGENAALTAEAALGILLTQAGVPLAGTRVALVGFGRIAGALLPRLTACGAAVTVFARRDDACAAALSRGAAGAFSVSALSAETLAAFSLVVNTVPAPLLTPDVLSPLSEAVFVLDLASGGVTKAPAVGGPRLLYAPGLPGRYYPAAAGEAVARAALRAVS